MIVIGIDPGLTGAIALIGDLGYITCVDMPVMPRGSGAGFVKNQVNAAALDEILRTWRADFDKNEVMVMIENQRPFHIPGEKSQGTAGVFSLGLTSGIIEGVVAAQHLPHELVEPGVWKKALKLTGGAKDDKKGRARAMAVRLYPMAPLARIKDHNRAEAILIARYGYEKHA